MKWDLKKRICWKYLAWRNYTNKGLDLFQMPIQVYKLVGYGLIIIGLFYNISDKSNFVLTIGFIVGIILLIFFFFVGWLWDKAHFFHLEREWTNERNPTLQEIKKNSRKRKI